MNEIESLFAHNSYLFVNKSLDIIFAHTKFNAECKEKKTFNLLIEVYKISKY